MLVAEEWGKHREAFTLPSARKEGKGIKIDEWATGIT
jgi:hypothetical protein